MCRLVSVSTMHREVGSWKIAFFYAIFFGELVFSVMSVGWFFEKSGSIGKVEDVKLS